MATTRLMPLHVGKGRDVSTAIADIIDYVENPQKTDFGKFIYGYECDTRLEIGRASCRERVSSPV